VLLGEFENGFGVVAHYGIDGFVLEFRVRKGNQAHNSAPDRCRWSGRLDLAIAEDLRLTG